jgi:cardiolipin synthase A/B
MPKYTHGALTLPLWMGIVIIVLFVALVLILWSVKRRRRPNLKTGFDRSDALHCTVSGLLQSTCVDGNRIELLQNGVFFDRLFADLASAKKTINFETFLCKEGELTRKLTAVLLKKRAEGVDVRVLLDGSGGKNYGDDDVKKLHDAGCQMRKFHPFKISNLGRFNNRTHRKMAIIDGRVGYVGGHCFVDTWLGDAQDKQHFRDITARVEGPVVTQIQSAFTDNWIEETGEVIGGDHFFPELEKAGEITANLVFISPNGGPSTVKLLHYLAIHSAEKSITLQNPYFLPDPDAREALIEAVKRGVEVRIMIPAVEATDAKIVQHASHHHYGTLLKGGVRIFDYQKTLLHQKVFTIDGKWSSIGSCNFDDRSFEINDEVALVTHDEDIARQLEETFERDLADARERKFDEWKHRPFIHKIQDGMAFLLNEQL